MNWQASEQLGGSPGTSFLPPNPVIDVTPSFITRRVIAGGSLEDDTFRVANAGMPTLDYTAASNVAWIQMTPGAGQSADLASPVEHTISYDLAGLAPGQHSGSISITDPGADNSPLALDVTVNIVVPGITVDSAAILRTIFESENAGNQQIAEISIRMSLVLKLWMLSCSEVLM